KKHLASPDTVTDEDNDKPFFTSGKAAMMFDSTGDYGGLKRALGDDLAVLPMPCNKVCSVPIGGAGIGILSTSSKEVQAAAYKFISFAASAPSNALWFSVTGYMPINKQTESQPLAEKALATEPGIKVAIGQLGFARGRPRPPVVTWMRAQEYQKWQAMALGQAEVTSTLKSFAEATRQQASQLAASK
ncbi:extracellular solute-binding protein, partial [Thioclava sp. BHET1]